MIGVIIDKGDKGEEGDESDESDERREGPRNWWAETRGKDQQS